jgi:imidazolonepropionase (EC 3.5.2.7)
MVVIRARQVVSAAKMPWTSGDPTLVIDDGAVVVKNGVIIEVGAWDEVKKKYAAEEVWDFGDSLITPGLVDPHTHLLFAGSREDELERKLMGETYEEITRKGAASIGQ